MVQPSSSAAAAAAAVAAGRNSRSRFPQRTRIKGSNVSGSAVAAASRVAFFIRWANVVGILKWLTALCAGYYAGCLHSSHYFASRAHEDQAKQNHAITLFSSSLSNLPGMQKNGNGNNNNKLSLSSSDTLAAVAGEPESSKASLIIAAESVVMESNQDKHHQRSAFCQRLSSKRSVAGGSGGIPSALDLWFDHYKEIHKASQLSTRDESYFFWDFTAELLHLISPRLVKSTLSLPQQWEQVQSIIEKLEKRIDYLQHPEKYHFPPPLVQIVVLGGSVLVGRNCRKILRDMEISMVLPNRECTWAFRLQVFLDQMTSLLLDPSKPLPKGEFASDRSPLLFRVTKIAMGGTNTAVGSQIFKYELLPEEAADADIILNAYATNDMHILTLVEMEKSGITLREGVFEMLQEFVRAVLQMNSHRNNDPCNDDGDSNNNNNNNNTSSNTGNKHPPLLMHLDDYLGNEQRVILQTMELSQSVAALAQYYGFSSVSYANTVRDIVYGDTHEFWFSPEGWWNTFRFSRGEVINQVQTFMQREIHPGMGMHITVPWLLAYNLLHIASTFCTLEPFLRETSIDNNNNMEASLSEYSSARWAKELVPLRRDIKEAPGRPRAVPRGLPPPLTNETKLDDISEKWRQAAARVAAAHVAATCDDSARGASRSRKCLFSWVSGLSLQQNNKTWIQQQFESRTVMGNAWNLVDEGGKLGFLPPARLKRGQPWVLELDSPNSNESTVTFFYLKSYGPKWKDSKLVVSVHQLGQAELLAKMDLLGFHAKNTSEMYTQEITFSTATTPSGTKKKTLHPPQERQQEKQSKIRIACELQGGTTFKIMGLAVCR